MVDSNNEQDFSILFGISVNSSENRIEIQQLGVMHIVHLSYATQNLYCEIMSETQMDWFTRILNHTPIFELIKTR